MFVGSLSRLDDKIDAMLHMQLVDLARLFTKRGKLEVEAAFHAHYDETASHMTVSQFWWDYPLLDKTAGMKSDVYLRCLGSAWFTGRGGSQLLSSLLFECEVSEAGQLLICTL